MATLFASCSCQTWGSPRRHVTERFANSTETVTSSFTTYGFFSSLQGQSRIRTIVVSAHSEWPNKCRLSEDIKDSPTFSRRHLLLGSLLPLCMIEHDYARADQTKELESSSSETREAEVDTFGFDGLGTSEDEYAVGKVVALAQAGDGAVLFLGVDGFELPLRMVVGAAEAMAILTAAQERRSRRPVTHEAWGSSLAAVGWKVDHVTITSVESDVFYSRLVLSLGASASSLLRDSIGDGSSKSERFRSVDMRPSDAIALALRCRAPLFINKKVAEDVVGELKKGAEPVKRQADPLQRPGLQAKSESLAVGTLSNRFLSSR